MSHETSLILSIIFSAIYAVLFVKYYRRPDGLGRVFLLGMLAALFIFWCCRSVGYGILVNHGDVSVVNQLLRWSAYAVALPGVWVAVVGWRHEA